MTTIRHSTEPDAGAANGPRLLLADHHREIEGACLGLVAGTYADDPLELIKQYCCFERAMLDHLAAEEEQILPAYAEHAPADAQALRDDHAAIRQALYRIGLEVELHLVRATTVNQLVEALRAHAAREDAKMYPWAQLHLPLAPQASSVRAHRPVVARARGIPNPTHVSTSRATTCMRNAMESDEPIVRARDLMERDVITVTPETRIIDVHRLFVDEEIHGAPVVGKDGLVHGVVSSLDLLRVVRDELEPGAKATTTTYFRDELPYSRPDWLEMPEDFQCRMQDLTAADAMTRDIVAVGLDATVDDIARTMREQHVHRVLVIEDRALIGVISTFDLLRARLRIPTTEPLAGSTRHTGYSR